MQVVETVDLGSERAEADVADGAAVGGGDGAGVKHVTVRNPRVRRGSGSANGTISPNCRLVQTPDFGCDSIVCHEPIRQREMNHSARFRARVETVDPGWREAEQWIERNGSLGSRGEVASSE